MDFCTKKRPFFFFIVHTLSGSIQYLRGDASRVQQWLITRARRRRKRLIRGDTDKTYLARKHSYALSGGLFFSTIVHTCAAGRGGKVIESSDHPKAKVGLELTLRVDYVVVLEKTRRGKTGSFFDHAHRERERPGSCAGE